MLMRRWFRIRGCLAVGVAGLVLCACQARGPAPATDPLCDVAGTQVEPIGAGAPVTRPLLWGQKQAFHFSAHRGDHLAITALQEGADLALRLCGPDGRLIGVADAVIGLSSPERMEAIAGENGEHRLVVEATDQGPRGRYQLSVENHGPASSSDRQRLELVVAAERVLASARESHGSTDEAGSERVARLERAFSEAHDSFLAAGEPERAAATLVELGSALSSVGGELGLEAAQAAFEEALALWRGTGNLAGQASTLNWAARIYNEQRRPAEALAAYRSALAVAEKAGDYRLEARALLGLGVISKGLAQFAEAETAYRRALAIAQTREDLRLQCVASTRLGSLLGGRGEITRALDLDRQSVDLCTRAGDELEVAGALSNLGADYQDLGRSREARDSYHRAAELAAGLGDKQLAATIALNEGNLLLALGQNRKARVSYETALALFEEIGDERQVHALLSLGRLERAEAQFDRALAFAERARERAEQGSPLLEAPTARALGVALRDVGRDGEGLRFLEEAAAEHRRLEERWGEAASLGEVGESLRLTGQLGVARRRLEEARDLSRRIQDPSLEALQLFRLAEVERDAGRPRGAVEVLEQALELFELVNRGVADPDSRATQLAFRRPFFELHVDTLYQRDCGRRSFPGCGKAALEASESARARGLRDLLAEAEVEVVSGADPALKLREQAVRGRLSAIQRRIMNLQRSRASDSRELVDLSIERSQGLAQLDLLEQEVRTRNARYAEVHYPKALGLAEIQARLLPEEGTALLEYALGETSSYLFVIRRQEIEVFQLAPAPALRRQVEGMVAALAGSRSSDFAQEAADLYASLVRPAEPALVGVERLLIVPDDALFSVPFEALIERHEAGRRPAYLLDRWVVSYAPSATVLAQLLSSPGGAVERGGDALDLVAFADPLYPLPAPASGDVERGMFDPQGRLVLTRLEASKTEVEEIAALFEKTGGKVRLFVRDQATEENVLGPEARTARNLHFAVHAFTDDRDPDNLGLVLSQLPDARDDGVLQLDEIFELKLAARLVVLSACGSALGAPVRGEGFVGLTRGFFYAGARSVVASLWSVEDRSSARLMSIFYRHLLATSEGGKAEALRQAKLEMIAAGSSDPKDWAAFVVVGDPR